MASLTCIPEYLTWETSYFLPLKTSGNSANVFMVTFSLSASSRMGLDPKYKKFIKSVLKQNYVHHLSLRASHSTLVGPLSEGEGGHS